MKAILETLTGQRQGPSKGVPLVYVQATPPGNQTGIVSVGDFWVDTKGMKLFFWNGVLWVPTT